MSAENSASQDRSDEEYLNLAFMALADPVRRGLIAQLSRGPATVNELADPFDISKQAISKHIHILQRADLVTRTREAQRRPVHLNPTRLEALTAWIDRYRLVKESQFRSIDAILDHPDDPSGDRSIGPDRPRSTS